MPTGQKAIDWTAENDAKLFLTILAVENVHPNCEAVAAAFGEQSHLPSRRSLGSLQTNLTKGGSVNATSITNRLNRLRKKAVDQGLIPAPGTAAPAKGSKTNGAGKKGKAVKNNSTVLNSVE